MWFKDDLHGNPILGKLKSQILGSHLSLLNLNLERGRPRIPHFLKDLFVYLFIFRERGREREKEGEKHQCVVASPAPPTRDLPRNPGICADWELNRRHFGSHAHAQFTEPYQPGQGFHILTLLPSDPDAC